MNYQIFSDSSCDTPPELIEKYGIILVPFYVSFNQENYYKENIDITNEEFYNKLVSEKVFPKTSLPSVQDYMNKFQVALDKNQDVLCICLSQKFSGSYQSAVNAKNILMEQYPAAKIMIIDSIQATAGQGLVLLQAAFMKEAGYSVEENAKKLEELKQTARIMFTVDTLEYLAKGGRIGKAASLAGTMLNLKPMIQLKDAELIPYTNVRGRKKALEKILFMVEEYFKENNESFEDYEFNLASASSSDDIHLVKSKVEELIGKEITYPVYQIGVTIGTYTGPGALGVCFIKKYNV
ncbi:DegV family protein with EDD domain [Mobilisporobacter senegalensis]|uniref:DegV family protein with EDD domain n=1 Tax=Mobilisporobacter senegalensis TaxID=1329262 RepID=A0A3N1X9H1_9FIRM|nr:DegV family protein [Mobilisporobacter senegalensis]ROR23414.1 DegV family protein with EDD domain [Mobilisporobacter senegalensis]